MWGGESAGLDFSSPRKNLHMFTVHSEEGGLLTRHLGALELP